MKKQLIFATNNRNKLKEIDSIIGDRYDLTTPAACGITEDIPEDQDTIAGNASQKSHYIFDRVGIDCFADDTGLEVEALNGAPGVYSARYAGEQKNSDDNIDLLLKNMAGTENRKARFKTVISLIVDGKEHLFEGVVNGVITTERHGTEGFGYDPVFRPDGYDITFAEMSLEEKNRISHRGKAVVQLVNFLKTL